MAKGVVKWKIPNYGRISTLIDQYKVTIQYWQTNGGTWVAGAIVPTSDPLIDGEYKCGKSRVTWIDAVTLLLEQLGHEEEIWSEREKKDD